ncbi:MAG: polysaccharide biosynthesis protein [Chryseobacterium sp.]|nr:MAG: polysaccharide biosynthesis protein [Chryseobacterium sp.]
MGYVPRWVIFAIDLFLSALSIYFSYAVLAMLNVLPVPTIALWQKYLLILSVNAVFMLLFKTYAGIIRHSTSTDFTRIVFASLATVFTLSLINFGVEMKNGKRWLLNPLLPLYLAISSSLLFSLRVFVKEIFHLAREIYGKRETTPILILGAGEASVAAAGALIDDASQPYDVKGFIVSSHRMPFAKLLGRKIYRYEEVTTDFIKRHGIFGILVTNNEFSIEETAKLVSIFLEKGVKILKAPSIDSVTDKGFAAGIKNLQIEDLLNRKPIKIDNPDVRRLHEGRAVLVTGGAGSIGSEIVRQVAKMKPSKIIILDQAETPLYEIDLMMKAHFPQIECSCILADISNGHRLESIFREYNFSVVYHAAAYKHVPIIEDNPHEAILVNVLGSRNLATLASRFGVERFVMVSTDKAVNPTNVMGASKRAAELFVQSLQCRPGNATRFITTRFGNVLGSNGSVIPHFKKQIEKGGPVTITHPDIVRYFMTIPEACELVLQAGTMGQGGEIFVFDMGEPVRIVDLAVRMIRLSGLEPGRDVQITYTGLRPGEKLYEELLSDKTKNLPTHHEKIMISRDPTMEFDGISKLTRSVIRAAVRRDKVKVVKLLKTIVPEYKSNNSEFEALDHL